MIAVDLARFAYTPLATFGVLRVGAFSCFTVERPWQGNEPSVSCIPEGAYPLAPDFFHRGGYAAYEVREVPERSRILIHVANHAAEVEGCIAPGEGLGVVNGAWAVLRSRAAFTSFMGVMRGQPGVLAVRFAHAGPQGR